MRRCTSVCQRTADLCGPSFQACLERPSAWPLGCSGIHLELARSVDTRLHREGRSSTSDPRNESHHPCHFQLHLDMQSYSIWHSQNQSLNQHLDHIRRAEAIENGRGYYIVNEIWPESEPEENRWEPPTPDPIAVVFYQSLAPPATRRHP